jgi:hypothetical protein
MWNLPMDALVFREDDLSCFISKTLFNRNSYDVMIWDKIDYYDKTGLVQVNETPNS